MHVVWASAPAFLALAFTLGGCGKTEKASRPPANISQGPQVGQQAPDIQGEDLDGISFKLSDYHGKVVVLAFWGDW